MKKLLGILTFALIIIAQITSIGANSDSIKIRIDNEPIEFAMPLQLVNKQLFVPFRETMTLFGYDVSWDKDTKTAKAVKNRKLLSTKIGSREITVDGKKITFAVASYVYKQRLYVPVQIIERGLNKIVKWESKENTLYISGSQNNINIDIENSNECVIAVGNNILVNITNKYGVSEINDMIDDADKLLDNNNFTGAISIYETVLENISSSKNPEEYGRTKVNIGNAYNKLAAIVNEEDNAEKAIMAYEAALKVSTPEKTLMYMLLPKMD